MASSLAPIARRLARRADGTVPFELRLWDGTRIQPPGGDAAEVTLVARSARALEYIVREPSELGLARAWVSGELDVEGDLERALSLAVAAAGPERERVWRLYMTAAALAFERGGISVHQLLAAAPGSPHRLPLARGGRLM